jgi:hypothetical protein
VPNPFGVDLTPISKSVKTGLSMVSNAGKYPSRAAMFGKKPSLSELGARMPKKNIHNGISGYVPKQRKVDNTMAETS